MYYPKKITIDTGDQRVILDLSNIPNKKYREVGFSIKTYPRPNRETQQIYINGVYFMSFPSRVYTGNDPNNILGGQAIELITYLYERGYNLKQIKQILDKTVNKKIKRRLVNPQLKREKKLRDLQRLINKFERLGV